MDVSVKINKGYCGSGSVNDGIRLPLFSLRRGTNWSINPLKNRAITMATFSHNKTPHTIHMREKFLVITVGLYSNLL